MNVRFLFPDTGTHSVKITLRGHYTDLPWKSWVTQRPLFGPISRPILPCPIFYRVSLVPGSKRESEVEIQYRIHTSDPEFVRRLNIHCEKQGLRTNLLDLVFTKDVCDRVVVGADLANLSIHSWKTSCKLGTERTLNLWAFIGAFHSTAILTMPEERNHNSSNPASDTDNFCLKHISPIDCESYMRGDTDESDESFDSAIALIPDTDLFHFNAHAAGAVTYPPSFLFDRLPDRRLTAEYRSRLNLVGTFERTPRMLDALLKTEGVIAACGPYSGTDGVGDYLLSSLSDVDVSVTKLLKSPAYLAYCKAEMSDTQREERPLKSRVGIDALFYSLSVMAMTKGNPPGEEHQPLKVLGNVIIYSEHGFKSPTLFRAAHFCHPEEAPTVHIGETLHSEERTSGTLDVYVQHDHTVACCGKQLITIPFGVQQLAWEWVKLALGKESFLLALTSLCDNDLVCPVQTEYCDLAPLSTLCDDVDQDTVHAAWTLFVDECLEFSKRHLLDASSSQPFSLRRVALRADKRTAYQFLQRAVAALSRHRQRDVLLDDAGDLIEFPFDPAISRLLVHNLRDGFVRPRDVLDPLKDFLMEHISVSKVRLISQYADNRYLLEAVRSIVESRCEFESITTNNLLAAKAMEAGI